MKIVNEEMKMKKEGSIWHCSSIRSYLNQYFVNFCKIVIIIFYGRFFHGNTAVDSLLDSALLESCVVDRRERKRIMQHSTQVRR